MQPDRHGRALMFFLIIIPGLCLLLTGCEDETVKRDYPRVRTLDVTNITEEGALFNAEVFEAGNVGITEHGFTWSTGNPDIDNNDRVLLGTFDGTGRFSTEIRISLKAGLKYKVSAFIRAGDYTVYGNTTEFTSLGSLGPVITGFSPERVLCGDTVEIRGKHFSWVRDYNKVFFNNTSASVCDPVTDTVIHAVVPYSLAVSEQTVSLQISDSRATFADRKLMVDLPYIMEMNPVSAHWGDTVELTVKNLHTSPETRIWFGQIPVMPNGAFEGEKISFIIPWEADISENQLKITQGGGEFIFPSPFMLLPPVIDRICPETGAWSEDVMLLGSFNKLKENSSVRFGQYDARIVYSSRDTLIVKVPDNLDVSPAEVTYSYRQASTKPVQFALKPPEIVSVSPMSGNAGTVMKIVCKNLKYGFVSVWLNDAETGFVTLGGSTYEDTYLESLIPGSFVGPATLRVTVCGQSDTWDQPVMVMNPHIVSFSPHSAVPGDTLTLVTENFVDYSTWFSLSPNYQYTLQYLSRDGNNIRVLFTDLRYMASQGNASGPIYAVYSNNSVLSSIPSADHLVQPRPEIASVLPVNARHNDEVTLRGANFSLIREYNHVTVGGRKVTVTECSREELKFQMPNLPAGIYDVELLLGGYTITAAQRLTCLSPWERLPDLPFNNWEAFLMDFNGDILVAAAPDYQSTVVQRNIYRYDPVNGRFNKVDKTISCLASYFGLVVKGDRAYISRSNGTMPPVLDVFDKNTMTLSKVCDLPASGGYSYWLMDGDSILLAGLGSSHWKFNQASGRWTRMADLPGETNQGHVFTIGGRNFIMTSLGELYEYNAYEDRWIRKSSPLFRYFYSEHSETVVCNNQAYICFNYSGEAQIAAYDPGSDSWEPINDVVFTLPRSNVLGFSIGDRLLIGGGSNYLDFWSFNTSWSK